MTKVQSHVMLVLYNVRKALSNVRKKIKVKPNVTMEPSNMRKK